MAIPIKEYIDIGSTVLNSSVGDIDFSGLVFTTDEMNETVASEYGQIATDYAAGKVVTLALEDVEACFPSTANVNKFAGKYFSYAANSSGQTPRVLFVVKAAGDTAKASYDAISDFSNYGAFTFIGKAYTISDIKEVAQANADRGYAHMFCVRTSSSSATTDATALAGISGCHLVCSADEYGAWMPMAWMASIDFDGYDTASTLMFKNFGGEEATVTTLALKSTYDAACINYIGLVQAHGTNRKFYQVGKNMDGLDAGIYASAAWMTAYIELAWFDLVNSVEKIPANPVGQGYVLALLGEVAMRGIKNGSILVDKEFSDVTKAAIVRKARNTEAVDAVQNQGFYTAAEIIEEGDKFVCKYTLIYAKGDHISKVEGVHALA